MEQALQQWRLAYDIKDNAFESLIAILFAHSSSLGNFGYNSATPSMVFPSFSNNVNGISRQHGASLITSTTPQLWQPQVDSMPFLLSEDIHIRDVSSVHYVPVTLPSDAIVSELVESSISSPKIASKKTDSTTCIKCWAEKKKVSIGGSLCQKQKLELLAHSNLV